MTEPRTPPGGDPEASLSGVWLGTYRIESRLGAGGMGEVYRAHDAKLGRPVAIKLLNPEVVTSADRLQRFRAEARAASSLNHPHILVIHDFGEVDGRPFMVTELVEGQTLRQRIEGGRLPLREAIDIARQVASALAAAHERGIVHRDIKPENIMIRADGYVKILDFGLAKLTAAGSSTSDEPTVVTQAGMIVGTPQYMSPEQASGQPVDFRSDQFSFGVVLYELVTGRSPFKRGSMVQAAAAVIAEEPEPVARLCPETPPPLRWAIERCLAKRPADRYSSTADLHHDLATVHDRISDIHRQPSALPAPKLPVAATGLVGREAEVSAILELLGEAGVRWVTLTGPGGVGKTRLAIHVARTIGRETGAAYFVPLATVADHELVASAIAQTLEVRASGSESVEAALIRHLRTVASDVLLVLDTFEHVAAAAPTVSALLDACERLQVLIASRARVNVSAEREYQVSPLPVPDPRQRRREAIATVPAVALFVERARAARADFVLTDDNAAAVADICVALDGLPLALELAAAHIKMLSPQALLARVTDKRLSLSGGARDLPTRQQTLRATIDWGYELLTPAEQRLFRRLAVFVGGWTSEAAEAVGDAGQDLALDVFDGISSLVDKSLVRPVQTTADDPRFMMLRTIREYAAERLEAAGESPFTRKAHAAYQLVLAEEGAGTDPSAQVKWLERCDVELPNFRAAIDHLLDTGQTEWAMRLAAALLPFWQARAHLAEGRDYLSRALKAGPSHPPSPVRARAAFALGTIVHAMGNFEEAEPLHMYALDIYRSLGDRQGQAVALNGLGVMRQSAHQHAAARASLEEALVIWRELGQQFAIARTLVNLAASALGEGDAPRAIELYREARAACERTGDHVGAAWAINLEAQAECVREQPAVALALYEEALQRFQAIKDGWGIGDSLLALGGLAADAGRSDQARELFARAHAVFQQVGELRGTLRVIEAFARLAAHENDGARALTLAGAAAALRQTLSVPSSGSQRDRLERALDRARAQLDPQAAAAAWMQGWTLSAADAVKLADGR